MPVPGLPNAGVAKIGIKKRRIDSKGGTYQAGGKQEDQISENARRNEGGLPAEQKRKKKDLGGKKKTLQEERQNSSKKITIQRMKAKIKRE